ncbi:glutaredoxin family protein [Rhodoferax sp.]|uniref:glutaredoxin family protein n=1 Tax=Rhodoferax sp. TaxID=50421 RepID=UPI00277093EA|nr:glutaredoxin family protein [Rhodoferax sp.]
MNITTTRLALALASTALALSAVQAQTIYRVVGPDGRVSFTDQPPAPNEKATATSGGKPVSAAPSGLPFELRQVISKYPVTLYTTKDCAPCTSGRELLTGRGVPFTERTVNTADDGEALKRLTGDSTLPLVTIGSQRIKGLTPSEWNQYLNAAGYPPSSQLPPNYRNPAATPLAPPSSAASAPKPDEEPKRPARPAPQPQPDPNANANPAGIKF